MKRYALIGIQFFCFLLVGWLSVQTVAGSAAIITVDTTAHEAPFVTNGNCTLTEAIHAASYNVPTDGCAAGGSADVIVVPAGVWDLDAAVETSCIAGGNCIFPIIFGDITIRGAGKTQTVLDAANSADSRFFGVAANETLRLEGMTLQNGSSPTDGGAVLLSNDATFETDDVQFVDNYAGDDGGAVATLDDATIHLSNSDFLNNGALNNGGGLSIQAGGSIANTRFESNSGQLGGAIYLLNSADLTISDSTFTANSGDGAAVHTNCPTNCAGATANDLPLLSITNSGFYSHTRLIFRNFTFRLFISEATFANNQAELFGLDFPTVQTTTEIEKSRFHDNHAAGMRLIETQNAFTVRQSAFHDNSGDLFVSRDNTMLLDRVTVANHSGNAVQPRSPRGAIILDRSTIVNNAGFAVVALDSNTSVTVQRSLIAGASNIDVAAVGGGSVVSGGGNVIGKASNVNSIAADDLIGTQAAPINAQLDQFRQTGPNLWDWTAAPLPGSPAIDRIAVTASPNRAASCAAIGSDQRGERWDIDYDRDSTVKCDSGAHERQADEQFSILLTSGMTHTFGATLATIEAISVSARNETTIVRHNQPPTNALPDALPIYWTVDPDVTGVDVNLTLCYTDWEVALNGNVAEAQLTIWHLGDNGWVDLGFSLRDTSGNCVTVQGLTMLGGNYTLANSSSPLAVNLRDFSAERSPMPPMLLLALAALTWLCWLRPLRK